MGRKIIDLTNQRFGRLIALERDLSYPKGQGKPVYWKCICDCGTTKSIKGDHLRRGVTRSCGCLSKELRTQIFLDDLTDKHFGRLVVIERDKTKPMGKNCFAYWKCQCICGNIVSVRGDHLRNGQTQSCGCLNSAGEEKIINILNSHEIDYKTQFEFKDLKGDVNSLRFDFAIFCNQQLKCLIEYQGKQHFKQRGDESIERFNKRLAYDQKKRDYCKEKNIKLVEIPYTDFNFLNWEYLQKRIYE